MKTKIDKSKPNMVKVVYDTVEEAIEFATMLRCYKIKHEIKHSSLEKSIGYDIVKLSKKIQELVDIGAVKVK